MEDNLVSNIWPMLNHIVSTVFGHSPRQSSELEPETIFVAGELLARGRIGPGYRSGFPEIDAVEPTPSDIDLLKRLLADALQQEEHSQQGGALIHALSKSADPAYRELYVEKLAIFTALVETASAGLYQTLIALDNLGEKVYERDTAGNCSSSLLDIEKNLHQAKMYYSRDHEG